MRLGMLGSILALALPVGACAQGVGAPPMVEPLARPADPYVMPDPSVTQAPPGGEVFPSDPFPPSPDASALPAGPPFDVDRVMDGVKKCWTAIPRVYGTEAQGGFARLRIKFTPDGRLDGAPLIIDKPQGAIGAKFAESAAKAVELCQPYRLPPERYAEWRQIEMRFDTIDPDNPPPPAPAPAAPPAADALPPDVSSTPDGYVPSVPGPQDTGAVSPPPPQ